MRAKARELQLASGLLSRTDRANVEANTISYCPTVRRERTDKSGNSQRAVGVVKRSLAKCTRPVAYDHKGYDKGKALAIQNKA